MIRTQEVSGHLQEGRILEIVLGLLQKGIRHTALVLLLRISARINPVDKRVLCQDESVPITVQLCRRFSARRRKLHQLDSQLRLSGFGRRSGLDDLLDELSSEPFAHEPLLLGTGCADPDD